MKVDLISIIIGAECGSYPEFPGQYEPEGILELGNVGFGSVFQGPKALMW
jgi:hypothetical protein